MEPQSWFPCRIETTTLGVFKTKAGHIGFHFFQCFHLKTFIVLELGLGIGFGLFSLFFILAVFVQIVPGCEVVARPQGTMVINQYWHAAWPRCIAIILLGPVWVHLQSGGTVVVGVSAQGLGVQNHVDCVYMCNARLAFAHPLCSRAQVVQSLLILWIDRTPRGPLFFA